MLHALAEKQQIPILVFDLTRSGIEPTIYRIRGEHANHYTTDAVQITIVIVFGLNQSGFEPGHNWII